MDADRYARLMAATPGSQFFINGETWEARGDGLFFVSPHWNDRKRDAYFVNLDTIRPEV